MERSAQRNVWITLAAAAVAPLAAVTACDAVLGLDDFERGVCEPGDTGHCSADTNTPQRCDSSGRWVDDGPPCSGKTCVGGVCEGECTVGSRRCAGETPQQCDAHGSWVSEPKCEGGQYCRGGSCGVECTSGDLRCNEEGEAQLCNEGGTWDRNKSCPQCYNCEISTGMCTSSPVPEGSSCNDGNVCSNPDTLDTCSGGICNPSGDHEWAHWYFSSAPPPADRYAYVAGGKVVYDTWTGRTWQRNVEGSDKTWAEAKEYCKNLPIEVYGSGWRLPTRIELHSIVDYSRADPAIDTDAFPDTPNSRPFWSSSPYAGGSGDAWYVDFYGGAVYGYVVGLDFGRVRCVR